MIKNDFWQRKRKEKEEKRKRQDEKQRQKPEEKTGPQPRVDSIEILVRILFLNIMKQKTARTRAIETFTNLLFNSFILILYFTFLNKVKETIEFIPNCRVQVTDYNENLNFCLFSLFAGRFSARFSALFKCRKRRILILRLYLPHY